MKPVIVFRHVEHEGLGILEGIFADVGLKCHCVDLAANAPTDFDPAAASGLVILGGPMNVDETDRFPFLAAERRWIRAAIDADLPVLGICLGAQLLARVLGAEVRPRPTKEIGWYSIDCSPAADADPLFRHLGPRPTVFQWHGDGFDLPPGAVHLAGSPLCPVQAFRHGPTAYGLQFHVEVTADMIDRWLTEAGNCAELSDVPYINPAEIRRRTPVELPPMQALGRKLLAEFAQLCRSS